MSIYIKSNVCGKLLLGAVGIALLYLPVQQSFAQLEEITVTARRFEESITDAPLAVAVMDMDFLRQTNTRSVQDILDLTPGATWNEFAKAQPSLTLRGVNGGNFGNATLESSVSVVSDGLPLTKAFMMTLPVYDQARVEVMRGPQGTSFGRNATLGLIHFISARPTQEKSGMVEASVGDPTMININGFFNGALGENLSGRVAYNYGDDDGHIEDRDTGDPLQSKKNTSIRGSLLWEPSDTLTGYFKAEYIKDEDLPVVRRGTECVPSWLSGSFQNYTDDCDPFKAKVDDTLPNQGVDREMLFLEAEFTKELNNGLALTWLSGYQDGTHDSIQDAFGTPFALRDQIVSNDANVLSTELRIDNYGTDSRFRWLAGISWLKDEEDRFEENIGFPERGGCGGRAPGRLCPQWNLITDATGETESLGIFGEGSFDITDTLQLTVGARYTDDSRDLRFSTYGYGESSGLNALGLGEGARDCAANAIPDPLGRNKQSPAPGVAFVCGSINNTMGFDETVSNSWDNISPRVSLSWAVNDNSSIYALYSEGFKAGGFQQDARNRPHLLDNIVDSEEVENYELGWKGSYDRALFAVTLFQMEQKNAQVNNNIPAGVGSSGNVTLIKNTGGVKTQGIELEGTFAITENFTVGGNAAFYSPEYLEGSFQGGTFVPATGQFVGEDISGEVPSNVPEETWYLWGSYDFFLSGGSRITVRADWKHRGTAWGQAGARNRDGLNIAGDGFMYERPKLDKLGLRATWTNAEDNLSVSIWGRNLDNDPDWHNFGPGIGYIFNAGQNGDLGLGPVRSRPSNSVGRRVYGATVNYRFGAN